MGSSRTSFCDNAAFASKLPIGGSISAAGPRHRCAAGPRHRRTATGRIPAATGPRHSSAGSKFLRSRHRRCISAAGPRHRCAAGPRHRRTAATPQQQVPGTALQVPSSCAAVVEGAFLPQAPGTGALPQVAAEAAVPQQHVPGTGPLQVPSCGAAVPEHLPQVLQPRRSCPSHQAQQPLIFPVCLHHILCRLRRHLQCRPWHLQRRLCCLVFSAIAAKSCASPTLTSAETTAQAALQVHTALPLPAPLDPAAPKAKTAPSTTSPSRMDPASPSAPPSSTFSPLTRPKYKAAPMFPPPRGNASAEHRAPAPPRPLMPALASTTPCEWPLPAPAPSSSSLGTPATLRELTVDAGAADSEHVARLWTRRPHVRSSCKWKSSMTFEGEGWHGCCLS